MPYTVSILMIVLQSVTLVAIFCLLYLCYVERSKLYNVFDNHRKHGIARDTGISGGKRSVRLA